MAFFIAPNLCLLLFRDPEATFTAKRLKDVLAERGIRVIGDEQPFTLQCGEGPKLCASIIRGQTAEILAGRLMGKNRKHRDLVNGCDAHIEISFESLDEVLDEINTLIEVQITLQNATGALMYTSWNRSFSGPEK